MILQIFNIAHAPAKTSFASQVYGLRTHSLPDFRKSAAECTAVPVGFYPCACLRFSNCRDSLSRQSSPQSRAPHRFFPEICRNHIVYPPSAYSGVSCVVCLCILYHSIFMLSTLCRHFFRISAFLQVLFIPIVQNAFSYKCNHRMPCIQKKPTCFQVDFSI